jgi:streptogramin lyase
VIEFGALRQHRRRSGSPSPSTKCSVKKLVSGPDGDVWFTCFRLGKGLGPVDKSLVGRITPSGTVTEFSAGIPVGAEINELVVGPDGNLWFTLVAGYARSGEASLGRSAIGRITPEGQVTLFSAGLRKNSYPDEIIAGSDGNLWFVDGTIISTGPQTRIGQITPQGSIAEFRTGLPQTLNVGGLAAGPDGNLWFTQAFDLPHGDNEPGSLVSRMTPEGTVTSVGSRPGTNAIRSPAPMATSGSSPSSRSVGSPRPGKSAGSPTAWTSARTSRKRPGWSRVRVATFGSPPSPVGRSRR